jgi:BDI_1685-like, C-terminal domain/Domain of unknown function (DUF5107)
MKGYFWKSTDVNAFGAYTPSLGTGLYHIADPTLARGMKLWSYGVGPDRAWATLGAATLQPYIEIQGGPVSDQSTKLELEPGETRWHIEYWFPTDKPLNIYALKVPESRDLRHIREIPLFGWPRTDEVRVWNELLTAYQYSTSTGLNFESGSASARKLPDPPEISRNCWAPSGMENLSPAFRWVIANSSHASADLWKFHYGAWLAGREETEDAISALADCNTGVAKALLGRLHRARGDIKEAAAAIEAIQEPWLQLHPQVVVERDKALRNLGKQTLAEREKWLSKVNALEDEWVVERKVQVLIDRGEFEEAKELLLSIAFQKVHQTYNRTELWMQICENLNRSCYPIPQSLGEDALARFGAYREFD